MRELYQRFGGDRERTVTSYAAAERGGDALRRSNVQWLEPEDCARRLFADGIKKGWLG
jgi:hypothetical protein